MKQLVQFNPKRGPNVIGADGILRLLKDGNELDSLTVMLREAIQNSWDARLSDEMGIDFSVRGYRLDKENKSSLSKLIGDSFYGWKLFEKISAEDIVVEIADTGTHGLTGPVGFENSEVTDQERFLKFVYEVGNSQQKAGAGGSFGYGKASFYRSSKAGTTAILTKVKNDDGDFEHRFLIKCVDRIGEVGSQNPGVFWWGSSIVKPDNSEYSSWVKPVLNEQAVKIWQALGGTKFGDQETGTKLLVFSPSLIDDPDKSTFVDKDRWNLILLSRSILHYFWAKWPNLNGGGGISFNIVDDFNEKKEAINLDNPKDISPYKHLIECLSVCKDGEKKNSNHRSFHIESRSPAESLGNLVVKALNENDINEKYFRYFRDSDAHIALMRNVEFVIDYHNPSIRRINDKSNGRTMLFGIFRTLDDHKVKKFNGDENPIDINEVYRASENQTHGSWTASNVEELGSWCKTYISVTKRRIDSSVRRVVDDLSIIDEKHKINAQAEFMGFLGQYIDGAPGGGQPELPSDGSSTSSNNGSEEKLKTNLEINNIQIENNGSGKIMKLDCVLETNLPDRRVEILPVCSDEDGRFSITNDKKYRISLPVKIIDSYISGNKHKAMVLDDDGTVKVIPGENRSNISFTIKVIGDCNFTLKAK